MFVPRATAPLRRQEVVKKFVHRAVQFPLVVQEFRSSKHTEHDSSSPPTIGTDYSEMVMVRKSFTAACVYAPPRFDDWMNPCAVNISNPRVNADYGFFEDPLIQFMGSACIDYTIQNKTKCTTKKGAFVGTQPSKTNCEFMKELCGPDKKTC